MKVLLADDHMLFRQGICLALQEIYLCMEIVEAGTVGETLERLDGGSFDVVLFDLIMPDSEGMTSLSHVVEKAAPCPLIVISASEDPSDIRGAIAAGARGYIHKSSSIEALRHGLPLVLCGEVYVPLPASIMERPDVPGHAAVRPERSSAPDEAVVRYRFTPRQFDVARLLLQGYSNKQIGRRLGLLEGTVKVHVREIMRKLDVQNRTQAALVAAQLRLFER